MTGLSVHAADTQSTRDSGYSIPFHNPQGDIRTVGMAGSNWALADSLIATQENPAGLALTLDQPGIHVTRGWLTSPTLFGDGVRLDSTKSQLGGTYKGWGFAFGSNSRQVDGNNDLRLQHNSWVLGTARSFLDRKLSLGIQAMTHTAILTEENVHHGGESIGFGVGAIYRFPYRILLGGSFLSGTSVSLEDIKNPVKIPWNAGLGLAFVPNHAFRVSVSLLTTAATPNSRLLLDESRSLGEDLTLQPRLGFSYRALDQERLKVTLTAGSYYDPARIEGVSSRFHATAGVSVAAWIFSLGVGVDTASGYLNRNVSAGLNLVRTLQWAELLPTWGTPPPPEDRRLLPDPFVFDEHGLPRNLVDNPGTGHRQIDILEASQEIPKRLEKRISDFTNSVEEISSEVLETIGLPELWESAPDFKPNLDLPLDWQKDSPLDEQNRIPGPW